MDRRECLKMLGTLPLMTLFGNDSNEKKNSIVTNPVETLYHIVIYGATPAGIACAVRAAREGLNVLIVNHTHHLGGMFVNGLGTMDTLYNGSRAPIYDELRHGIYDYYRKKYGSNSKQCKDTQPGSPKNRFESHVVEHLFNEILMRESRITIIKGYYPINAIKADKVLESVTFHQMEGDETIVLKGEIFADCSYEGDLAAVAGVNCRIGRESRHEYGEKHAGVIYMEKGHWPPGENIHQKEFDQVRRLNLFRYDDWSDHIIYPESTGEAHQALQAFNIRTTLTDDPNNQIMPEKPKNYDPEYLRRTFGHHGGPGLLVPNLKTSWNQPELVGEQNKYIEGDWSQRKRIYEKFRDVTLGLLYFRQNDKSVPKDIQKMWRKFGLAKDEYKDNGHMPYEVYVRESRRIIGHNVFTENDAVLAEGLKRAPIHPDSISITEWFMDSHACTEKRLTGSKQEGEVMLKNKTFPGQVPFGSILPQNIDNLLVPVCLSASHVGWGTIRLEPTWMSIGEAAGYAAILAIRKQIPPASVDSDELVRLLARKHIMLSFFNGIEGREYSPWYPAIQYLATKSFFGTYDALPDEKLKTNLADAWLACISKWIKNHPSDSTTAAKAVLSAEQKGGEVVNAGEFAKRLGKILSPEQFVPDKIMNLMKRLDISPNCLITRGDACRMIFEATS